MLRPHQNLWLPAAIAWIAGFSLCCAADAPPKPQAERPYLTMFAASLERLQSACGVIFESVQRPDLANSLSDRLSAYRDFAGIDRTKPLGMMSTWGPTATEDIIFVPVSEIQELLKTATFGVVGYHQVSSDHYEIERPGTPYQAFVRKDYVFLSDSLTTIRSLRVTPEQLTRRLRDQYDLVLNLDLLQIPQPTKSQFIVELRSQFEPWMQPQDDEAPESANFRKTIGQLVLNLVERVVLDTRTLTIGGRLDPEDRQFHLEVLVEAVSNSPMAIGLNRMPSHRSEFAPLLQSEAPAGVAFNLPVSGLAERILGKSRDDPVSKASQLEAGLQLAGTGLGDLSLIAALRGSDAAELNEAIPRLITMLIESGRFSNVRENFDIYRGVVLHSMTPQKLPAAITQWIGADVEIIIGQDRQTVWIGMGHPEPLLDRLLDAIELVDQPVNHREKGPLVRARFQAQKLPIPVVSDLLLTDSEVAKQVFAAGKDGFNLSIVPIPDGLKLRVEFEEGFTKLIGQNWVRQLERPPGE